MVQERVSMVSELPAKLLTVREVARLLSAHPSTIRRWSDLGLLTAYRLGSRRDRRFDREQITHFREDRYPQLG